MFQISFVRARALTTTVLITAMASGAAAWSSPLDGNDFLLRDAGQDNHLKIVAPALSASRPQVAPSGNRLTVAIKGDRNGGWGQSWQTPLFDQNLPAPGLLMQVGWNNTISLVLDGQDNLFSMSQSGSGNSTIGQITGYDNAATVVQHGHGNMAVFSQTGSRNALAITQNSW